MQPVGIVDGFDEGFGDTLRKVEILQLFIRARAETVTPENGGTEAIFPVIKPNATEARGILLLSPLFVFLRITRWAVLYCAGTAAQSKPSQLNSSQPPGDDSLA